MLVLFWSVLNWFCCCLFLMKIMADCILKLNEYINFIWIVGWRKEVRIPASLKFFGLSFRSCTSCVFLTVMIFFVFRETVHCYGFIGGTLFGESIPTYLSLTPSQTFPKFYYSSQVLFFWSLRSIKKINYMRLLHHSQSSSIDNKKTYFTSVLSYAR